MRLAFPFILIALLFSIGCPTGKKTEDLPCTCYYSFDEECSRGFVCEEGWDPIACIRMKPKGGAYAGMCTEEDEQRQVRPCDAICKDASAASVCAGQDVGRIASAFDLWRQAMTAPAERGGGPIDRELTASARAVDLTSECIEYIGWRTLAVLELCRGHAITDHSDPDHDALEEHVLADLSGDRCRVEAGNLCIRALAEGVSDGPAAVDSVLAGVAGVCPGELPFASAGPGYENVAPLDGVKDRLKVTVQRIRPPAN